MNRYEGTVPDGEGGRADRYLAETAKALGRSRQKALGARFLVNGKEAKPSRLLKPGDRLVVEWDEEAPQDFLPEDIPLAVIYEDDDIIVVDKPQGMVTHPAHGNWTGTLANALLGRLRAGSRGAEPHGSSPRNGEDVSRSSCGAEPIGGSARNVADVSRSSRGAEPHGSSPRNIADVSRSSRGAEGPSRAGIIHRLDKDTSGVIVCAKTAAAQDAVAAQFRDRSVAKEYLAIVKGRLPAESGRIENRLGRDPKDRKRFAVVSDDPAASVGKLAVTAWKTVAVYGDYALVRLKPRTGRTHQLRVHMKRLGCPILGDPLYAQRDRRFPDATLMLHARRIRIALPSTSASIVFNAVVPERFKRVLHDLRKIASHP